MIKKMKKTVNFVLLTEKFLKKDISGDHIYFLPLFLPVFICASKLEKDFSPTFVSRSK